MCCLEQCREQRLVFGFTVDLARRLDGGCTGDLTLGLATGVGLNGKVMVEVDYGKKIKTDSFRILKPGQDEDTCEGGNDVRRSNADFEEME